MTDRSQCCVECVWWGLRETQDYYNVCHAPVPDAVIVLARETTARGEGADCPTFKPKPKEGETT